MTKGTTKARSRRNAGRLPSGHWTARQEDNPWRSQQKRHIATCVRQSGHRGSGSGCRVGSELATTHRRTSPGARWASTFEWWPAIMRYQLSGFMKRKTGAAHLFQPVSSKTFNCSCTRKLDQRRHPRWKGVSATEREPGRKRPGGQASQNPQHSPYLVVVEIAWKLGHLTDMVRN